MAHGISTWWDENGALCISMDASLAHELVDALKSEYMSTDLRMLASMVGDRLVRPERRRGDVKAKPESTDGG